MKFRKPPTSQLSHLKKKKTNICVHYAYNVRDAVLRNISPWVCEIQYWKQSLYTLINRIMVQPLSGLPWWLSGKESTCQCRRPGPDPLVGKMPWRRKWQPTPVFLPGKFHGQRSLVGYSPRVAKELTQQLCDWTPSPPIKYYLVL